MIIFGSLQVWRAALDVIFFCFLDNSSSSGWRHIPCCRDTGTFSGQFFEESEGEAWGISLYPDAGPRLSAAVTQNVQVWVCRPKVSAKQSMSSCFMKVLSPTLEWVVKIIRLCVKVYCI